MHGFSMGKLIVQAASETVLVVVPFAQGCYPNKRRFAHARRANWCPGSGFVEPLQLSRPFTGSGVFLNCGVLFQHPDPPFSLQAGLGDGPELALTFGNHALGMDVDSKHSTLHHT